VLRLSGGILLHCFEKAKRGRAGGRERVKKNFLEGLARFFNTKTEVYHYARSKQKSRDKVWDRYNISKNKVIAIVFLIIS
jgi:hypothetical protein